MNGAINALVSEFESGRISRRQLITQLTLLAIGLNAGVAKAAEEPNTTFKAVGLNHIALRVTDVQRSASFYQKHLGLTMMRDGGAGSTFLKCGDHFVALFRGDQAGMDHYCYSIENYDVSAAEETLKKAGLEPEVHKQAGRIYFKDPDGL